MKKKSTTKPSIVVISGVNKQPVRYKLWQVFSNKLVKATTITLGVVAIIFVAGLGLYANRIAVANSVYALFGLDLDRLAASLAISGEQRAPVEAEVTPDEVATIPQGEIVDGAIPSDSELSVMLEPETAIGEMAPVMNVSEDEIAEITTAAMINDEDNYEEEAFGGSDE